MFRKARTSRAAPAAPDWRSFDRVADIYDRIRAPLHEPAARDLVAAIGDPAEGGFLDVGSGTGVVAAAAQAAGWRPTVSVDRSLPMLARARARGLDRLVGADAVDLPFRDARFGAVGAGFVLHVLPRYDTTLFDMSRVLRPGGTLGTATWDWRRDEFTETWRVVAESFTTKELLDDAMRRAAPWAERFSQPEQLEEALREAGMRSVRVERRQYRATVTIDDYLTGREISAPGRFLREILGQALWERFRERVDATFRERFEDPIGDTNDVLLATGTKPA
ncbi:MAG TPA: methyltransferase domain-containing protein [Actinomycetota bacterium]|nr:methyltransferase domain-containing protein [Actinomycetota bacterium]HEX5948733.1 methyltransferase domain-containing protein [Actinomycetota bacterium]